MRSIFSREFGLAFIGATFGVVAVTLTDTPLAPAQETADDGVPTNLVAYFANGSACPAGWEDATDVRGYVVIGTANPARVGEGYGTPLGPEEDRTHTHQYDVAFTLDTANVAGANSCCNESAAGPQSPSHTLTTAAVPSGLPFVQYRACVKR